MCVCVAVSINPHLIGSADPSLLPFFFLVCPVSFCAVNNSNCGFPGQREQVISIGGSTHWLQYGKKKASLSSPYPQWVSFIFSIHRFHLSAFVFCLNFELNCRRYTFFRLLSPPVLASFQAYGGGGLQCRVYTRFPIDWIFYKLFFLNNKVCLCWAAPKLGERRGGGVVKAKSQAVHHRHQHFFGKHPCKDEFHFKVNIWSTFSIANLSTKVSQLFLVFSYKKRLRNVRVTCWCHTQYE